MPDTSDCESRALRRDRAARACERTRCCRRDDPRCFQAPAWSRLPLPLSPNPIRRDAHSLVEQEIENHTVERRRVLDLRPMAAMRENMHLRVRHHARDLKPDIERAEAVVQSPNNQKLRFELAEIGRERLARQLSLALSEKIDRLGIDARLVALLENLIG